MPLAALASLFDSPVAVHAMTDFAHAEPLRGLEKEHVARAVPKRRMEFAAGRTCARRALASLGVESTSLPARPDRSVAWPSGVVGAITHTDGFAAAAVARAGEVVGVGLDAEVRDRVHESLWPRVARPSEIEWIRSGEEEATNRAVRLFSAKEAFYKAQHALSGAYLGFHDACYEEDDDAQRQRQSRFRIRLDTDVPALVGFGRDFGGRWLEVGSLVLTALVIRRR